MGPIPNAGALRRFSYKPYEEAQFLKADILAKLKTAEEETARQVERAKERAAEIVKGARRQADDLLRAAEEEARRDQEAQLAAERKRLGAERDRIVAEGAHREEKLRQHYAKNADGTLKKGLDAFLESFQ